MLKEKIIGLHCSQDNSFHAFITHRNFSEWFADRLICFTVCIVGPLYQISTSVPITANEIHSMNDLRIALWKRSNDRE